VLQTKLRRRSWLTRALSKTLQTHIMASRVLVTGAVRGQLKKALEKISKLHTKTDFSFAIIVGDLFDDNDSDELNLLLTGELMVPLPIYFTVGDSALPEAVQQKLDSADEVCPNLLYLGRKGVLTTSEGIRIVTLGGRLVQNDQAVTTALGKYDPLYLETEAKGLRGANFAHILITNQWPANITDGSQVAVAESIDQTGTQCIADLCSTLKPRYHFSSSLEASWEREPFVQVAEYGSMELPPVTRFRSLAGVSISNKEWVSAFTLDPTKAPEVPEATSSPLSRGKWPFTIFQ